MEFGISRFERALCLSKDVAVYVQTYAELCRDLRRHLRLFPNLNLNPVLYLNLYLNLDLFLFQKPFEKPNPALFRWLYGLKYRSLYDLVNLAPYRET